MYNYANITNNNKQNYTACSKSLISPYNCHYLRDKLFAINQYTQM